MEETGVVNVADPLGGSWYVEALTDRIEAETYRSSTRSWPSAAAPPRRATTPRWPSRSGSRLRTPRPRPPGR